MHSHVHCCCSSDVKPLCCPSPWEPKDLLLCQKYTSDSTAGDHCTFAAAHAEGVVGYDFESEWFLCHCLPGKSARVAVQQQPVIHSLNPQPEVTVCICPGLKSPTLSSLYSMAEPCGIPPASIMEDVNTAVKYPVLVRLYHKERKERIGTDDTWYKAFCEKYHVFWYTGHMDCVRSAFCRRHVTDSGSVCSECDRLAHSDVFMKRVQRKTNGDMSGKQTKVNDMCIPDMRTQLMYLRDQKTALRAENKKFARKVEQLKKTLNKLRTTLDSLDTATSVDPLCKALRQACEEGKHFLLCYGTCQVYCMIKVVLRTIPCSCLTRSFGRSRSLQSFPHGCHHCPEKSEKGHVRNYEGVLHSPASTWW